MADVHHVHHDARSTTDSGLAVALFVLGLVVLAVLALLAWNGNIFTGTTVDQPAGTDIDVGVPAVNPPQDGMTP